MAGRPALPKYEAVQMTERYHRTDWEGFDGELFQDLVVDLLKAEGYKVEPSGVGPDKGVDIFAEQSITFGYNDPEPFVWAVQCKFKSDPKKSVSPGDVGSISDVLMDETFASKSLGGYFLATNGRLSTGTMSRLRGIGRHGYKSTYWDYSSIQDVLDRQFKVYSKYFWRLIEAEFGRRHHGVRQDAVSELAELLGDKEVRERDLAAFFTTHPDLLAKAVGAVGDVYVQIPLGSGERVLMPDFVIVSSEDADDSMIIELKHPSVPLVSTYKSVPVVSRSVHTGVAQLRDYIRFFDDPAQRQWAHDRFGFDVYRPRGVLIAGRTPTGMPAEERYLLRSQVGDIRLLTYDQLLHKLRH